GALAGEKSDCILLANTSYNDQMWQLMINRGAKNDYTLPPDKNREQGTQKNLPGPIPINKIKADWEGESKEVLLAKPDMLPQGVRDCPRAHLVPPRAAKKSQISAATGEKRKGESNVSPSFVASTAAVGIPPSYPPPPFPRPSADLNHGKVMDSSFDWETEEWTHYYETGTKVTSPSIDNLDAPAQKKQRKEPSNQRSFDNQPQNDQTQSTTSASMELDPSSADPILSLGIEELQINKKADNDSDTYESD
ncbi:MAG: hypothetical protein HETSPECPRED_001482, partial [Heterodermia speciosa]